MAAGSTSDSSHDEKLQPQAGQLVNIIAVHSWVDLLGDSIVLVDRTCTLQAPAY